MARNTGIQGLRQIMKRRSFIASLVQTVAAAAVAAKLVREDAIMPVQHFCLDDRLRHYMDLCVADICKHTLNRRPWLELTQKKAWPPGLDETIARK